ncbi:MAG: penicillin-binding protein 2 [Candidatus Marinimicrobia bacterium]|nr:penicillin-binding protein 2 [Candidatus Neomarinimicrobiota bacterium]
MNPDFLRYRKYVSYGIVFIAFSILIYRLFLLQIYHHSQFRIKAESNSIREEWLEPARGKIFDRNGVILAENYPSYSLSIVPWEVKKHPEILPILSQYLSTSPEKLQSQMEKNSRGLFRPSRIYNFLTFEQLSFISEELDRLKGLSVDASSVREYPFGRATAHLLGYVREPSHDEFQILDDKRYQPGENVGSSGIEKAYENLLKGYPGFSYQKVDALGKIVEKVTLKNSRAPIEGDSLILTIDIRLQMFGDSLLSGRSGSIIVSNANDGALLCFVSHPGFNPVIFGKNITTKDWNELLADSTKPLYNRALQGLYPPGSIYKIITAIAALKHGIISQNHSVFCPGFYRLGNRIFRCWKEEGHGNLKLLGAIEQSCNVYFMSIMREMNVDQWSDVAHAFGLSEKTEIALFDEKTSVVPDREFLDKKYGKGRWTAGNLTNQAIGQGDILITPIKLNQFIATIANYGKIVTHKLALHEAPTSNPIEMDIQNYIRLVRLGMFNVVNGEMGTAKSARIRNGKVYGKTGTAQNPHGENHAWFGGFVEFEADTFAVSVLVENGGMGGAVAAPIAGKVFSFLGKMTK